MTNTIVFRGLMHNYCGGFSSIINSVRKWHNGQVVLATWENQNLDFDISLVDDIVLVKDPGRVNNVPFEALENTNRQLTLAIEGVKKAIGEKILLTRTDIRHEINLFDKTEEDKLIIPTLLSADPDYAGNDRWFRRDLLYFRPSDFFQCGHSKDVKNWASEDVKNLALSNIKSGRCIEQLWCVSYLNIFKGYNLDFYKLEKYNNLAWKTLIDNFIILDLSKEAGAVHNKPKYSSLSYQRQPMFITAEKFKQKINEYNENNLRRRHI